MVWNRSLRNVSALRFASSGSTATTQVVALQEPGEEVSLSLPDTDETAPDRKLRELLADEHFGETEEETKDQEENEEEKEKEEEEKDRKE